MAKRTVRIPLPKGSPEQFVNLLKHIVRHHEELGASSPLNVSSLIDMADFKQKLLQADALREESIEHLAEARAKLGQAKKILGLQLGQTINTEGTLFCMLETIKRLLLNHYRVEEQNLEKFGFHVVVGEARFIGRPRKKKTTG